MSTYCLVIWTNGSTLHVSKPFEHLSVGCGWNSKADISTVTDTLHTISKQGWTLKKCSFQREEHTYLFEK